jgi:hypothetical protein
MQGFCDFVSSTTQGGYLVVKDTSDGYPTSLRNLIEKVLELLPRFVDI